MRIMILMKGRCDIGALVVVGRVFYFRPGHETYPVFQQAEPLKVIENAVRWLAKPVGK